VGTPKQVSVFCVFVQIAKASSGRYPTCIISIVAITAGSLADETALLSPDPHLVIGPGR
jgi:hypothetical protein